jgi:hypothetical protein
MEICEQRDRDCDHVGNCGLRQISTSTTRGTGVTSADIAGSNVVELDGK